MTTQQFDPEKFIGREYEQNIFQELLTFQNPIRVLLIQDSGGMGKSLLLQQFRHLCLSQQPMIAATLIPLDQLPDQHPLALMATITQELGKMDVAFPRFNQSERERTRDDMTAVSTSSAFQESEGKSTANRGDIRDTGEMSVVETGQRQRDITPMEAFFADLNDLEQPTVLLLDAYERCQEELRIWITETLLTSIPESARLLIVVAGRQIPQIDGPVQRIEELTRWERDHVVQYLEKNGISYSAQHLGLFGQMAERGMPPSLIIQSVNAVLRRQNR